MPVAIRETLLAAIDEPEHRQVCVAFLHFDGTDELLGDAGPRGARGRPATARRRDPGGGRRVRVCFLASDVDADGGKLILTAGAPKASLDGEERMLLALRRIVDVGSAIPFRIGVNRGPVFAGDVGPRYRRTYTVMGDAVNLAARVMAKAHPGQVLATGSRPRCLRHPVRDPGARALHGEGQARPGDGVPGRADRRRAGALRRGRSSARRAPGGDRRDRRCDGGRQGGPRPHDRDRRPAGDRQDAPAAASSESRGRGVRAPRGDLRAVRPGDRVRAVPRAACATRSTSTGRCTARMRRSSFGSRCPRCRPDLLPWLPLLAIPVDVEVAADAGGGRPRPGVPAREARMGGRRALATARSRAGRCS